MWKNNSLIFYKREYEDISRWRLHHCYTWKATNHQHTRKLNLTNSIQVCFQLPSVSHFLEHLYCNYGFPFLFFCFGRCPRTFPSPLNHNSNPIINQHIPITTKPQLQQNTEPQQQPNQSPTIINLTDQLPIKFSRDNYILWKAQIISYFSDLQFIGKPIARYFVKQAH